MIEPGRDRSVRRRESPSVSRRSSGMRPFKVGAAVIGVVVVGALLFGLWSTLATIWFAVKVVVFLAIVAAVVRLIFRRRG